MEGLVHVRSVLCTSLNIRHLNCKEERVYSHMHPQTSYKPFSQHIHVHTLLQSLTPPFYPSSIPPHKYTYVLMYTTLFLPSPPPPSVTHISPHSPPLSFDTHSYVCTFSCWARFIPSCSDTALSYSKSDLLPTIIIGNSGLHGQNTCTYSTVRGGGGANTACELISPPHSRAMLCGQ